jgi:phage gp46-like protein
MTIRIAYIGEGEYDYVNSDGLEQDDGLETSVIISLFTDAPATADELASHGFTADQNRGWWGDDYPEVEGDVWGSLLWLLERSKRDDETLAEAKEFAERCLAWLVDDGVAQSITASTAWHPPTSFLRLEIEVIRMDGKRWSRVWNATSDEILESA